MKEIGDAHFIENKGPGKSAKQTLKKSGVVAIEVKVNRDKIARAKDAAPTAEADHSFWIGRIRLQKNPFIYLLNFITKHIHMRLPNQLFLYNNIPKFLHKKCK